MKNKIKLLDTTLRDGSYVVNFQFTAKDTAAIALALENAGVRLIEIGHGLGLNASNCGKGKAAESDEIYLEMTASVLKKADWGVFFIPGIGRKEDIHKAVKYGIKFIRIGINVNEVEKAIPFICLAKELGLWVSANLMKTYALCPAEVAIQAKLVAKAGADIVAIVDSAGGMLPNDVANYIRAIQANTDIDIGFHGHDNLGLAVANSLKAVEYGATVVDTSILGMGRSTGNAITEITILVLKKHGIDLGIDVNKLMDVGDRIIKPMLRQHKHNPISMTSGYAQFHSSYLGTILKYADKHRLDPRELIIRVCEQDRIEAPDDLVAEIASQLAREKKPSISTKILSFSLEQKPEFKTQQSPLPIKQLLSQMQTIAGKHGKQTVFNLVISVKPDKKSVLSRFIQENFRYAIGSAEIYRESELKELLIHLDGEVDYILVDSELNNESGRDFSAISCEFIRKSVVLSYKDIDVWVKAAYTQISELAESLWQQKIVLVGTNPLAIKLALLLAERGAKLVLVGEDIETLTNIKNSFSHLSPFAATNVWICTYAESKQYITDALVLIGCIPQIPIITPEMVKAIAKTGIIVDLGIGSLTPEAIKSGNARGLTIIRVDMRAALASEIDNLLGTQTIVNQMMGKAKIGGISAVAGGLIGNRGDIVLDSITHPTQVIGVADGQGYVISEPDEQAKIKINQIETKLLNDILSV